MGEPQTIIHDELQRRLVAKAFQPFVVVTEGGTRYSIVRKFQAALGERVLVVLPPDGDGSRIVRLDDIRAIDHA